MVILFLNAFSPESNSYKSMSTVWGTCMNNSLRECFELKSSIESYLNVLWSESEDNDQIGKTHTQNKEHKRTKIAGIKKTAANEQRVLHQPRRKWAHNTQANSLLYC